MLGLLGVALLFGLVNALVGPLLRLVSLPLTLVTFGLFALVINAALLGITAGLTDALDVGGFFETIVAAIVISLVTAVLTFVATRVVRAGVRQGRRLAPRRRPSQATASPAPPPDRRPGQRPAPRRRGGPRR